MQCYVINNAVSSICTKHSGHVKYARSVFSIRLVNLNKKKREKFFIRVRMRTKWEANKQIQTHTHNVSACERDCWTQVKLRKFERVRHCEKLSGFVELLRQRFQPHQQQQEQQRQTICLVYESLATYVSYDKVKYAHTHSDWRAGQSMKKHRQKWQSRCDHI